MRRRDFIAGLGSTTTAWPLKASSQPSKVRFILWVSTEAQPDPFIAAFREAMRERGYLEGQNLAFVLRYAPGDPAALRAMLPTILDTTADLIVSSGPAILAMRAATDRPVLFAISGDPVALGIAQSFPRPGGNFTGTTFLSLDVAQKRVQLVNKIVADHPDRDIHVVLDNLNTHKPKRDGWLPRHPNVRFHFTPTHASWMNQVEIWFSILSRSALQGASFTSPTGPRSHRCLRRTLQYPRQSVLLDRCNRPSETPRHHVPEIGSVADETAGRDKLAEERLELLRELVPSTPTVALLANPKRPGSERQQKDAEAAARALGLTLLVVEADDDDDLAPAF